MLEVACCSVRVESVAGPCAADIEQLELLPSPCGIQDGDKHSVHLTFWGACQDKHSPASGCCGMLPEN